MKSSDPSATTEVNARLRELAEIFAGALFRPRPRTGLSAETSATPAEAAFSPVEVPPHIALSVPDGLRTRETQERGV